MSSIYHSNRKIKVSSLGGENSLPTFCSSLIAYKRTFHPNLPPQVLNGAIYDATFGILPYTTQDQYDRSQKDSTLNTIVLENEKLKATFYPQFGGRLASLYDKVKKKELLFDNPVFQPANLALRNAWFSGGVEWNSPVYGHSLLTCSPIYFAKLKINNFEILRIYEYDRLLNSAWQIDFYLPDDSCNLWYHVTARNLNDYEIPFYWWTNIAAPITDKIRFITPDNEFVAHAGENIARYHWPIDNNIDISYPRRYASALSVFYLEKEAKAPWFSYADENGYGLFHMATPRLKGKKLWYFGYGQGGTNWMDTLSLPGKGQYMEMQAGITETQFQVAPIPAKGKMYWTACIGPISCDPEKVHHQNYQIAIQQSAEKLNELAVMNELKIIDQKMSTWQDLMPSEVIHSGEAWGALQEKLSKTKIPGMLFTAPITEKEKPWLELLSENDFSQETLHKDPVSWNISKTWQQKILDSMNTGHQTWLHHLHLGIAFLEENKHSEAKSELEESIRLKSNFQALRGLAIIENSEKNFEKAIHTYWKAWRASNGNRDLYLEIAKILIDKNETEHLASIAKECPKELENHEFQSLAKAVIALKAGHFEEARNHLVRNYSYIKEGNLITTNIWFETYYQPEEKRLGRNLTDQEKEKIRLTHKPPAIIDFQLKV